MREAVGLFENMEQLQEAVKEFERTEFPRDALSVLGEREHIEKNLASDMVALEDDPTVEREAPVRSEEKGIGAGALVNGSAYIGAMAVALASGAVTIPAIITAAAIGGIGGATVGGILAKILGNHFDKSIEQDINKGGLLLWVRTPDPDRENMALNILNKYGAHHVKIHEY